MRLAAALAALFLTALAQCPAAARAECAGVNVFDGLPAGEKAALRARVDAAPYAQGNLWQATRGGQQMYLAGTYHLDDPRHAQTMERLAPLIDSASAVLVEAAPEDEKALMDHVASDPSLMLITDGPTLVDTLPPQDWAALSQALRARNIPPFMAAKFQPWYLTVLLAVPPCGMADIATANGLDKRIMARAQADGIPLHSLEPYDTVFRIFGHFTAEQQLSMIRATLATEDRSADFSKTLADSYFAGDSRLTWELMHEVSRDLPGYTPAQVDAEFALMEEALMNGRNRAWIPVIEAAAQKGPVFVAFGALHLSGDQGVLNLLARDGWTITRLN